MAAKTLDGFKGAEFGGEETQRGIQRLHDYATWGHRLGGFTLVSVEGELISVDDSSERREKNVQPSGRAALSGYVSPETRLLQASDAIPGNHVG